MAKQTLFIQFLKESGWTEIQEDWDYQKNAWFLQRDTGAWWMVSTAFNL